MKWFSIKGIIEEMKQVHWMSFKELVKTTLTVILFSGIFVAFFVLCDLFSAWFFRTLGM
ncbi:MAG: preprotein translocase subunit SecE [Traorella sp.]